MRDNKFIEYLPVGVYDVFSAITHYDASNCSIKDLRNGVLDKFYYLQVLYLDNNLITVIDKQTLDNCEALEALYIRWNKIGFIKDTVFILAKSLEILMLDGNELTEVDFLDKFPKKSLRELSLSSNSLSNLRENIFKKHKNLESIWLDLNKLTSISPKVFDNLPKLTAVDLSNNYCISWSEGNLKQLKKEIKKKCSLG